MSRRDWRVALCEFVALLFGMATVWAIAWGLAVLVR